MGRYRARDLLLVPNWVSLLRLPLAWLFVQVAEEPLWASLVLLGSGLTDVIDGYWARRFHQATPTGAVVDGVTDKVFAASVVLRLLFGGALGPWQALALATREVFELPLVLWWATHRAQRAARAASPKANWLGKAVTTLQFGAVLAALYHSRWTDALLIVTATSGIIAAAAYWKRELAAHAQR